MTRAVAELLSRWRLAVLACGVTLLVACVSAPVQEMSDARQAVAAAAQSGGDQKAVEQMHDARDALAQAEVALKSCNTNWLGNWRNRRAARPSRPSISLVPNSSSMHCQRFLISGRVQGVFYRASTRTEALRLGLVGYARNLPDGRVEVLACGESTALKALNEWLWQGPPAASVTGVVLVDVSEDESVPESGFATR